MEEREVGEEEEREGGDGKRRRKRKRKEEVTGSDTVFQTEATSHFVRKESQKIHITISTGF